MPTLEQELSQIPWGEKSVASGKADKVPQALLGLISPDEAVRNRSYWQLDNEVVLQSDLYEAAYFVIPVLIEFLSEKVPHGRERIYDLLYEVANGDAPRSVTCRTAEGDEIPLKEACSLELAKGLHVFRRDTRDANPLIRQKASSLLDMLKSDPSEESLELDTNKIDDAVLALLFLGLHDGGRAWKGFDWDAMERLHEKGYISDPRGKAKSVLFTKEGLERSERLLDELFARRNT